MSYVWQTWNLAKVDILKYLENISYLNLIFYFCLDFKNEIFPRKMYLMAVTSDTRFHQTMSNVGLEMINLHPFAFPGLQTSQNFLHILGTGQNPLKSFPGRYTGARDLFITTLHFNRDKKLIPIIRLLAAANSLNSVKMC